MEKKTIEQEIELAWQEHEDALIAAYVPEADVLSREEAVELAFLRNLEASSELAADVSELRFVAALDALKR